MQVHPHEKTILDHSTKSILRYKFRTFANTYPACNFHKYWCDGVGRPGKYLAALHGAHVQSEPSNSVSPIPIILINQGFINTCISPFTLRPSLPSLPSFPSLPSLPSFPFSRGAIFLIKLSSHIGLNSKGFASSDFFESDIRSFKEKEKV